jgi:hypothetical protein
MIMNMKKKQSLYTNDLCVRDEIDCIQEGSGTSTKRER